MQTAAVLQRRKESCMMPEGIKPAIGIWGM
jgi:hypothetical protein